MKRLFAIGCRWSLLGACGVTAFATAQLGMTFPAAGGLILAYCTWKRLRRWRGSGWAYGTARVGNFFDICQAGWLTNKDGLIFGRASFTARPTRWQALRLLASPAVDSPTAVRMVLAAFFRAGGNSLIRINHYVHVAVFGSTGSGKGVGIVLPFLLSHFGSCVVTDPKGENAKLTAKHREKHGHTILRLDPFGLTGVVSDALNPLDMIDDLAPDFPEQVAELADALIVTTGNEREPHFPESAKIVLGCIIAFVCACVTDPDERNLQTVRHILKSRHRFDAAIVAMQQVTTHGGLIAGMGHQLTWYIEKELASVQTTIARFTAWLDSPAMQAITRTSSFDPRKFKTCKATLYLVLPVNRLKTLAPLNRMWISTLLRAMTQGNPDERTKVHFLLDEAGHLGHMQILEDAVTLMRGYGIRLIFFFQSIGQVSEMVGERASRFLDNIGTQLYFGVNAYESAEAISKRCGDATLLVESLNESTSFSRPSGGFSKDGQKGSVSTSRSVNTSEIGRPLYRPDEVLRLSDEVGLLFHRNLPVIPVKLLRYYREPEFRRGGSGRSGSGVVLRAGLVAAAALLASLGLLAVAFNPPRPHTWPGLFKPANPPFFLPPPAGDAGSEFRERRPVAPGWQPSPFPPAPQWPGYVPPPSPRGNRAAPVWRQRAMPRGDGASGFPSPY
jgi:type IV secretion system protein VirD4